jgi:peptidoglycan/LPS O-acetylase OafA/YrhL
MERKLTTPDQVDASINNPPSSDHEARPSSQVIGLDFLRLLAAAMVMLYHFGFWHLTEVDGTLVHAISANVARATMPLTHFGWVGVEIFFFISGFVITFSAQHSTVHSFVRSRFLRLVPAVWICAPLTAAIYYFALNEPMMTLAPQLVRTVLFFPLSSSIDGVYWTLGVEISFYILIYLLLRTREFIHVEYAALFVGAVSLAFWITALSALVFITDDSNNAPIRLLIYKAIAFRPFQLLLIQHGCFFALGILIWAAFNKGLSMERCFWICALVATCWLEIIGQNGIISRASHLELSPVPALAVWSAAFLLFICSLAYNQKMLNIFGGKRKLVRGIGLLTYPLYLFHNPLGLAIILICLRHGVPDVSALLCGIAAGLSGAIIVSLCIEPAMRRRLTAGLSRFWTKSGDAAPSPSPVP